MEKLDLLPEEEKSLVGVLYNHISFGSSMEIFGELEEEGIKRIDNLRNIFVKLLKKYSLVDKLSKETYLILGIAEFIDKPFLEQAVQNEDNKHLQIRAKYLLKKYYE